MNQVASVNKEGLSTFVFGNKSVRIVGTPDAPMFVAKDVAVVLGYSDTYAMTRSIDEEDRGTQTLRTPSGDQDMVVISESGLYSAIMRSTLPDAKAFKKWVTSDVLPSIRRHGVYATPQTIESMLADPDFAIQTFQKLKEERTRRIAAEEEASSARQSLAIEEGNHKDTQRRLTSLRDKLGALINSNGKGILIRDAAKFMQCNGYPSCKESLLRASLQNQRWLTKGHRVTATEKAIKGKVLTVGDGPIVNHSTGWEGVPTTPRVTGKGMVWIVAHMGDLGFHKEPDCGDLTINLEID